MLQVAPSRNTAGVVSPPESNWPGAPGPTASPAGPGLGDLHPGDAVVRFRVPDDASARPAEGAGTRAGPVPHAVEPGPFLHDGGLVGAGGVEGAGRAQVEHRPVGHLARHLGPGPRVAGDGQPDAPEVPGVVGGVVELVLVPVLQHPDVPDLLLVDGARSAHGQDAAARARTVVALRPVDPVGGLGVPDPARVGEGSRGAIEGLSAAVVPHAIHRSVLQHEGAVGEEIVEGPGGADVQDRTAGLASRDPREVHAVGGPRQADAPVRAVDAGAGPGGVAPAVVEVLDSTIRECAHREIGAFVERPRGAQPQERASRARARDLLPGERREGGGVGGASGQDDRGRRGQRGDP